MAETSLPEQIRAVLIRNYVDPLKVEQIPLPKLSAGQALIRVEAAPINPSDILHIAGIYPSGKPLPVPVGLEGSGTIVQVHQDDTENQQLIGKRVLFISSSTTGSWSEYAVSNVSQTLEIDPEFKSGEVSLINPLTAVAMLNLVQRDKHQAVIHNAGSSALGKMLIKLFLKNNIHIINIVRKEEQIQLLQNEFGSDLVVLNSNSPTFLQDLQAIATKLNATISLDAVGGSLAGQILTAQPEGSVLYNYGSLALQKLSEIDFSDLQYSIKSVKGFWLGDILRRNTPEQNRTLFESLKPLFKEFLASNIYKTYKFDEVHEALKDYEANSSKGKIIIVPN